MKFTWTSSWVADIESEKSGWVFVDLDVPDPFFKPGYGEQISVMTKTKTLRTRPDDQKMKLIVKELKAKMIAELKTAVSKLTAV